MKQGIVKFSKEFITPTGLKEWVSLEWEVGEPFDEAKAMETFRKVKDFVCNAQPSSNGLLEYLDLGRLGSWPIPVVKKEEDREVGLTPELIMGCGDITTLQSFYLLVDKSNRDDLKNAYAKRKQELVAKETKEILDATNALTKKSFESLDDNK